MLTVAPGGNNLETIAMFQRFSGPHHHHCIFILLEDISGPSHYKYVLLLTLRQPFYNTTGILS